MSINPITITINGYCIFANSVLWMFPPECRIVIILPHIRYLSNGVLASLQDYHCCRLCLNCSVQQQGQCLSVRGHCRGKCIKIQAKNHNHSHAIFHTPIKIKTTETIEFTTTLSELLAQSNDDNHLK